MGHKPFCSMNNGLGRQYICPGSLRSWTRGRLNLLLLGLQVEVQLKAHTKNARALDYNPATNDLMTCSFDKTVKVFT